MRGTHGVRWTKYSTTNPNTSKARTYHTSLPWPMTTQGEYCVNKKRKHPQTVPMYTAMRCARYARCQTDRILNNQPITRQNQGLTYKQQQHMATIVSRTKHPTNNQQPSTNDPQ